MPETTAPDPISVTDATIADSNSLSSVCAEISRVNTALSDGSFVTSTDPAFLTQNF